MHNDLLLFHKIVYDLIPVKLPSYLSFFSNNNTRTLRSSHLDRLSLVSSVTPTITATYKKDSVEGTECKIFENTFFYRSHLAWNNLSFNTRAIEIPAVFKSKLRKLLWEEALCSVLNEFKDNNLTLNFIKPKLKLDTSNLPAD